MAGSMPACHTPLGPRGLRRGRAAAIATLMAVLAAGCTDGSLKLSDLDPFAKKEAPLPGTRVSITGATDKLAGDLALADKPLALPPPRANETWAQPGAEPSNVAGHLALGTNLRQVWSGDAGTGSSKTSKVTASPIVAEGKVFTLDAAASVSAFSAGNGARAWKVGLAPSGRSGEEGFGGGLAYEGGKLYVTTGFGQVIAMEPGTGKIIWQNTVGAAVRSSPTVTADRIFIVTTDARFVCLSANDGSEIWSYRGAPEKTSIISNPSPAVDGDLAIGPFPSGEVVAVRISTGQPAWTDNLSRSRIASGLTAVTDVARPAIEGGLVFTVGHGGRMVASQVRSGERVWSLNIAGTQTPVVAGDTVYVVDTSGQLMAITKRDGKIAWTTKLAGANTWSGPVLAGGLLWVTSHKGTMVGVDAIAGKVVSTVSIGNASYIGPIVAGGRLYVLTDNARLIAFAGG